MASTFRRRILLPLGQRLVVVLGASALSLACFLVLPLIQAITEPDRDVWDLDDASTASLAAPDTTEAPEPEPEPPEPEEEPPEFEPPPPQDLSLDQLDAILTGEGGTGGAGVDMTIDLSRVLGSEDSFRELLDNSELDQRARAVHKVEPVLSNRVKRLGAGTVYVIFIVDEKGRVRRPKVQSSPDPAYDKSAIAAIKQWRFEPAQKDGQKVSSRVRVGIQYPDAE